MAWKNLLVNGKNKITARTNALSKIQTDMANRTTATNVNSTPNLPTPTVNSTNLWLRKAAQPVQTPIVQNNAMNNLNTNIVQPVQATKNVSNIWAWNIVQEPTQSRFIGLQQQPKAKSVADITKSALYIPTAWGTAWKANKKEENKFRTNEQALLDFQADVLKKKGKMKDADIKRLYPEFADQLDVMKELQTELRPIVKNWQWVDGEQLAQYYPELIQPKNLQDVEAIRKQSEKDNQKLQSNIQKVEKVVTENFDVLSPDWQKYVQDYLTLAWVVDSLKKNYRIVWGANDDEILQYAIKNNPQLKWVADELQNLTLSELDKATIDWNSQSIITSLISGLQKMTRQANTAVQNFAAEQNYIDQQTWNTGQNVFNTTWNVASNILWTADQATTAWARFFWNQNVNYNVWDKEAQEAVEKQEVSDLLAMWWWYWKTIWGIATAPFEYWKLNPITKPVVEEWIEPLFEWISNLEKTITNPVWDKLWFNEQDKENADALVLAEMFREFKAVKKDVKVRADAAKDVVSDAFKKTVKSNKRSEMKNEFQKAWVYDEAWHIKPEAKMQAAKIIAREFGKDFTENFKNNAKQWGDVVDFYRGKEGVKSYKEQISNIKEWVKDVTNTVKETGKNVWKKVAEWIDKWFDKMDESIETRIDKIRNKVTKEKTTEIKAEETAPIKDTAWWSQPKKWVVSSVVWWLTKVGNKINEKVIDPLATKWAEAITSTTAPQDKLFKALNPSLNVLSRKKWNYDTIRQNADRANELIIEYGDTPTNASEYYNSVVNTKKKIWNNWIQQGLDEYKYTTIDAKDLINPVREALKEFTTEPLEALKGDVKKLEAELQAIENKGIISLLEMETKKRQINAILEYWLPPDASQIYEKWMRELNRQIGIQEDRMISEIPWEFSKFKRDYGALTSIEEEAQKRMIQDMKKKLGGNLIQNWSRIEGLGKMGKKGSFLEWAAQIILWESLGKVKEPNFLIESWFKGLRQQYWPAKWKPEGVKIKKKPPTPALEDKRTDVEKWKLLEIDKRTKSNREEWYKTKNAVTSEKSAVTEKKSEPKAETKKPEIKEEKKEEQPKQEIKNKVTAEKPVKKSEPKKKTNVEKFREETAKYYPDYQSIENGARDMAESILRDAWVDAEIVDLVFTWSKSRGLEHDTSDFDILIELKWNDLREDTLFDILNDKELNDEYDFNPILADKTGTLEDVVLDQEKYMSNKRVIKEIADEYGIKWDKELADDAWNMHWELIKNFLDRTEWPIEFSTHWDWEVAGALDTKLYKQNPQNMSNTFYVWGNKKDMEFLKKIKRPETENSKAYAKLFEVKEEPKNVVTQKATVTTKKPAAKKTTTAKEQLQAIVNKYKDIQMDDFSDENSEWWGVNSQKFKNFAKELKKAYQAVATEDNMELTDYNVWYYNVTAFFKNKEWDTGQYYYVSLWDVRDPEWRNGILYRTARDSKDYHGGSNQYTDLENLAEALKGNKSVAGSRETNTKNFMANLQRDLDNSPIITMNNGKLNKVTAEDVVKKEEKSEWNAFGLKEQKGSSRINNFTNVVKKIIDKYSDDIEGDNLFIELWEPYLPLEIDYEAGKKQLIVRHPNLWYDDPAIRFTVGEDWKLQPTWIKQAFMEQMMDNWDWSPIKETDELLHTWAVNLEDQYLNERNIDEDTGIMKTTTEITGDKNAVTAKTVAKSENQNIIGKNNSLTTKNPTNDRNNETDIGKKDEWQAELSNSMSNAKANDWGRTRPVDQWAWTSWEKSVSASSNNISEHRAWLENGGSSEWVRKSIRTKWDDVITEKTVTQARDINRDCVDILEKHEFSSNPADYTKEEIETLKQYEGRGGINDKSDTETQGALNQYYTKDNIIKAMWRLLDWYSNTDILEPSMWVGRFFMYAPEWSNLAGFEYDKIPWTIAKILYPNADIKIWDFQDNFMLGNLSMWDNYRGKKYDIVIWNPPYEERQGRQKALGEEPKISRFDDYFIKRGVDMLKPWGHLAFVTSSQFLRWADNYAKQKISENAELIDAYRIPVGAFDRTGVETDIIVLRKKEWGGDASLLSASKWFDEHPEKILGEERDDVMGRFWPKKAVVGDLGAIDEIAKTRTWTDWKPATLKSEFTPMNEVKETKAEKPVTTKTIEAKEEKKAAPVKKFSDKDWKDWTEVKTKEDWTQETITWWKSLNGVVYKGKGWPTGRMSVGKWWVGKYQKLLNANWKIWDPTITLESDREWLNYIAWELEPNLLYASGQIPLKLEQLEKDYEWGFIDEKQYNKQKDLLEQAIPQEIEYQNIYFSPYLDWIMDFPTNEVVTTRRGGEMIDEKAPIRTQFKKYIREKMDSYPNIVYKNSKWDDVTANAGRVMLDIVWKWNDFPASAKERVITLLPKEYNKFLKWPQLDTDTKARLQTEYNKKYNSYANFDYSELWYTVDDISETFMWDKFNTSDVQARGIARILTTESMIIAHGVGQGKTIEWIIGAVASMQQWKARKALVVIPAWTKASRMQTTAQLFPNQEMVDLGSLAKGTGIRKKLVDMYWPDPRDWIQDWQLVFLEHSAIWRQISFKSDTLTELEQNLTDVMESHFEKERNIEDVKKQLERADKDIERSREKWASAADLEKKQKKREELLWDIQKMWRTTENTLQDILNTYADKWLPEDWIGKALELIDEDYDAFMNDMWEYLDHEINVGQAKINKADALKVAQDIFNNERAIYMEDLWIDHMTVDEAHNFRNLFNKSISDDEDGGSYHAGMQTKEWSKQAKNLYAMSQYIMSKNGGGNVILLTATPFINDPSEMYNMLSYVGKNGMMEMWVTSMDDFYDNFVWLENKLTPTASTSWVTYKNVMIWFNNTETLVKNLLDRYIDYEWESLKIVKPRLITNVARLKMSEEQAEVENILEEQIDKNEFKDEWRGVPLMKKRKLNDKWEAKWAVLEWMQQANLNLISPYLTKYLKDKLPALTWQEMLESSPKLQMVVDIIKRQRDMWIMRGTFIYMDQWKELHEKLKTAIEESIPWVKVWIINWDKKYADLSASEAAKLWIEPEWAKARQTAKKFSDGELDVLIWWANTKEWINLQGNWYHLIEVSQPRNMNDRTQLNGRMWRQWNLSNEVLDTLLLMENSSDIYRFELMARKEARWNILEQLAAYKRGEKVEDVVVEWQLDMNEEKLALFTDPEKKARVSITMEEADLKEQQAQTKWQISTIEKLIDLMSNWKNDYWRYRKLGEWVTRMDKLKDEDGKAITTDILADNALEPLEQQVDYAWNEAMKKMQEYNERRTDKWTKAEMEKNIRNNSPYSYEAVEWKNLRDKLQQARGERNLVIRQTDALGIDTVEWLSDFILELEQQLRGIESKLTDVQNTFNDKVTMFRRQAEENKANEMDKETILKDLEEDFKHQTTLANKEELRNWIEVTKNLPKREQARNKNAVTGGKNKYSWNAKDYVWQKATFDKPKNLITSKYEWYSESNPKPEIKYIWYTPKEITKTKDWWTLTRIWYQTQFQKMNNTLKAIKKKVVDTEEAKSYWRRDDVNEILWQNDYYNGLKTRLSNMILKFAQRYDTEIIKAFKSDNPWKTPTWPEDFYNYINNYSYSPSADKEIKVEDEYVKAWAEHLMKAYNGNKNNVIATDKNRVTSWKTQAARASRPSIRMNVEEREKKNSKNVVVNPDWKQVPTNNESKNWKKVVVDSKWKAYSFYHGTPNWWFEEFDMNSRGSANDLSSFGDFGKWFYFTPDRQEAINYATLNNKVEWKNPEVYEVKLYMNNPLDFRKYYDGKREIEAVYRKSVNRNWNYLGGLNEEEQAELDKVLNKYWFKDEEERDDFADLIDSLWDNRWDWDMAAHWYDGVIWVNGHGEERVVFDKNQIEIIKHEKQQLKNWATSNDKNRVTNNAARAYSPTIVMRLDENGNPVKKNKVTSKANTNQNDISDLDPDLVSKVWLKYKIKDANDEVLHGLIDYVLKKKWVKPVKNGLRGKIYSMNQALPKLKKWDDLSKKNAVDRLWYKVKDMALYRMAKKNNEYILDEKKKNDNNTHINFKVGKKSILLHMSNELYNILKWEWYIVSPWKYFYLKRKKKLKRGS